MYITGPNDPLSLIATTIYGSTRFYGTQALDKTSAPYEEALKVIDASWNNIWNYAKELYRNCSNQLENKNQTTGTP